jgi:hypothetical protein
VVALVAFVVGVLVEHSATTTQVRTIAELRYADIASGIVAVRGTITYSSGNRFVLRDDTGRVELATCPPWYRRIYLRKGDEVTAIGEILNNAPRMGKCDFILSVCRLVHDGEVIHLRSYPGIPPWATYRSTKTLEARDSLR